MCGSDSDLEDELHLVRAGVIQSLNILRDIHVELGHTPFQVLIQLCNLNSQLHQMVQTANLHSLPYQPIDVFFHMSESYLNN